MNCFKGVRVSASKKVMWPIAQLKSLYTSAHSTGNKQDELVATAQTCSVSEAAPEVTVAAKREEQH